ncbi:MAG TPA: response regulator [Nocardioidaceae bacterium]|nr:response regulator [Nocardioidaceae bacterium]
MTRVLVVEDDEDIRDLVAMLLSNRGYDVLTRGDAADVLTLARTGAFDVLLMDVSLPGRDGLDTTRLMRAEPAIAELPVLLMTARTRQEDIDRGYAAGADDYVVKPFISDDLVSRLEAALERRRVSEH